MLSHALLTQQRVQMFTPFKHDDGSIQAEKVRHPSSDTTDVIVETTISKQHVYILRNTKQLAHGKHRGSVFSGSSPGLRYVIDRLF